MSLFYLHLGVFIRTAKSSTCGVADEQSLLTSLLKSLRSTQLARALLTACSVKRRAYFSRVVCLVPISVLLFVIWGQLNRSSQAWFICRLQFIDMLGGTCGFFAHALCVTNHAKS